MYRFGDFDLDGAGRVLEHAGETVHLEPQAFDLLVYLVEHRDRVVEKNELLDRVWGHTFLSDANLTTRIKEIRRALGDDGRQQHTIKNVRGRGYRFVAEVASRSQRQPRSHLIGRDGELLAIRELLGQSRLVTLTGAGGAGKSSLARAAADAAAHAYRDGVYLVELATVASGEHVLAAVARVLDIVADGDQPDDAVRSIARLDALLVLDNCEHVIDSASTLVDQVLSTPGARIRVLATSQIRLGLSAEIVLPVTPLSVEEASALFTARALAVDASWDPQAVGLDRIARLVASLDGLPLTIEMAAGRLASMTFDDLDRAIAAELPLLQMTHRAPTHRHRSLVSLVQWSAELLDARERDVFTRFSVFAGAVSADDTGAVLAPEAPGGAAFDLAALAERSLVVADRGQSATRYAMLTTVRTVAQHWLDESGHGHDVRRQHAEHVAAALDAVDDQLRTTEEREGRRRLDELVGEARAAHRWAQGNDPQLASRMSGSLFHAAYSSLWLEPAEWSRTLLARHATGADERLPGATVMAAAAAAHRGDLSYAREHAAAVAALSEGRVQAIGLEVLADVALYEGDLEGAIRIANELGHVGEGLGDRHASAFATVDVALARVFGGDPHGAIEHLDQFDPRDLAPTDRAWLELSRGDALSELRDPLAAAAYLEAIELGATVGNRFVVSVSQTALATQYARIGELGPAVDGFHDSLQTYIRHGNHTHAVTAMRNLIGLLATIGDDHGAVVVAGAMASDHLRRSYGIEAERISDVLVQVEHRVGSSRFTTWFAEGQALDLDAAVRSAAEFIDRHRSSGSPHVVPEQAAATDDYLEP